MKGRFISVDGADGCGKSTHIDFIKDWLNERGAEVIHTREPGGTAFGELLRQILLNNDDVPISARSELLLIFAARMQHVEEIIVPNLNAGKWVLCERFTDATYAYQGGGRGIDTETIAMLEEWTHGDLQPNLTLLLDIPVEISVDRVSSRGNAQDRFERQELEFKESVRKAYQARAAQFPQRIRLIDANNTIEHVRAEISSVLENFWQ